MSDATCPTCKATVRVVTVSAYSLEQGRLIEQQVLVNHGTPSSVRCAGSLTPAPTA